MMKKSIIASLTVVLIATGTATASAHTVLIASTPVKGSKVKALPSKITLKFADPLLTLGKRAINFVVVTDPMNSVVTTGQNVVKGAVLTDPIIDSRPMSGIYKVSYRVSAQDGHIVTGAFSFTLQN
jgi:methionine-rich copper-binding protein CopC